MRKIANMPKLTEDQIIHRVAKILEQSPDSVDVTENDDGNVTITLNDYPHANVLGIDRNDEDDEDDTVDLNADDD